jgi:hypothetical protein
VVASAPIVVNPPNVDYTVTVVNNVGGTTAGGPLSGNFTIRNVGTASGVASVTWTAYLSADTTIDISDTTLATGSVGPLGPGATNGPIGFSGTWPAGAATWYLIVKVSASDDINPANDATASGAVPVTTVSPVYTITAVPVPTGSTTGQAVSGTFTIQNGGTAAGSSSVTWQVYASLGDAVYNAGDILLASGSTAALGIAGSSSPGYAGTWPSTAGTWYIVVRASAADAPVIADAASPSVAVTNPPPPNYTVSFNAAIPWSGLVGTLMSATGTPQITISNLTGNTGHATITWSVYLSADNVLDAGDTLLAQGTNAPLGGLGSTTKSFDATWPAAPGKFYWFIARVSASDDSNPLDDTVTAPHVVATGNYRYVEVEPNGGSTPTTNPTPNSNTGVTTLVGNQSIVIEGVMDAAGNYDTYKFVTSAALSQISIRAMWTTGFDDVDLYFWDSVGSNLPSQSVGIDSEPGAGTFDVVGSPTISPRTCFVSAWFYLANNTSGSTGQKYVILVSTLP